METSVKAVVFAKKLRAHLITLKAQHVKDLAAYKRNCISWKVSLASWIGENFENRVKMISSTEIKDSYSHYPRTDVGFDAKGFFHGAPKPPTFPKDDRIRAVQRTLQHIAITGQDNIRVSSDDIKKFFGDVESDE